MSLFRKSDYSKEKTTERRSVGYTTKRGVKLPTQIKSTSYEKKFLIKCPTGCTQRRTVKQRLAEKRTFDTRTNKCRNCGFEKKSGDAKFHGIKFQRASEL